MKSINSKIAQALLFLLSSCSTLPQLAQTVEEMSDNAITIEVNKEAFGDNTDLHLQCDIVNKDLATK